MKFLERAGTARHRLPQRPDGLRHRERRPCAPYLERRNSERFKGVNDLVFDSRGNLYFTDQGQTGLHDPTGRLYRLRRDGRLDLLLANVPSPNGVALSADERVLYLGVTRGNAVWRVPLVDDGSVAKVSAFFTSYGPSGPDGLAMDQQGAADRRQSGPRRGLGTEPSRRARRGAAQPRWRVADQRRVRRPRPRDLVLHRVCQRLRAAGGTRRTRSRAASPLLNKSGKTWT